MARKAQSPSELASLGRLKLSTMAPTEGDIAVLSKRFREALEKDALSQNAWATKSGVDSGVVSDILKGKVRSRRVLRAILDYAAG
jgi:hypothetical protein